MDADGGSSGAAPPKVADFDQLVDEILAKKGPVEYTDGLTEKNWEEVSVYLYPSPSLFLPLLIPLPPSPSLQPLSSPGDRKDSSVHDEGARCR